MNAKIFIKTKTKQINLRRNRIGALNRIDCTLFTNKRDRKWRMAVLGFFQRFSRTKPDLPNCHKSDHLPDCGQKFKNEFHEM